MCDRCDKPFPSTAKPYRVDVSGGPSPQSVREQSLRRLHGDLCATCAAAVVSFVREGVR